MEGVGHLNSVIGLGQAMLQRGHQVVFLLHNEGKMLKSYGFEYIQLTEPEASEEEKARQQAMMVSSTNSPNSPPSTGVSGSLFASGNSLEKMKLMTSHDIFASLAKRSQFFFAQLIEAVNREKPDLVLLDHVLVPPALAQSGVPYVLVFSANPVLLYNSPKLPPLFSGYPTDSDPSTWAEFAVYSAKFLSSMQNAQRLLSEASGGYPLVEARPIAFSPYLNIYSFPREWDYGDIAGPLPPDTFYAVDTFSRTEPGENASSFQLPPELSVKPGDKLIYLALGTMASNNIQLMVRITSLLGRTAHKCIVSKGKRAAEYDLPGNCWGAAHLPQTSILPMVDLVITHAGNNTVAETFFAGKPAILLPVFADQFDNAQRIEEKGFAVRLDSTSFTDEQLLGAIDRLLDDEQMKDRLQTAVKRMKAENRKEQACIRMEKLVKG